MRGSIKQRSKGSWRLRYEGPPDASGKRKQVSETVRGTKTEADGVLRERLVAVERGNYVNRQRETVGEFLDRWLGSYASTNTTLRTQQGYRGVITRYIGCYRRRSAASAATRPCPSDVLRPHWAGSLPTDCSARPQGSAGGSRPRSQMGSGDPQRGGSGHASKAGAERDSDVGRRDDPSVSSDLKVEQVPRPLPPGAPDGHAAQ